MLTERQMLRAFESAVASGDGDRLCWAARAALHFVSETEPGPWFMNQLAERLPAWRTARGRLTLAEGGPQAEGTQAIESLAMFFGGSGRVELIDRRELPFFESAAGEAEAHALADFLGDEDRLRELRCDFALPSEPEPVLVVGAIEFHGPRLVRMYHEGQIERPWGDRQWGAEPALIEDAILLAFAMSELQEPERTLEVVRRVAPHLRELEPCECREVGAQAFSRLCHRGLVESAGLGIYLASKKGALLATANLMPAWARTLCHTRSRSY